MVQSASTHRAAIVLLLTVAAILAVPTVAAASGAEAAVDQRSESSCNQLYEQTTRFLDEWNRNTDKVPGFIRGRISGRTIDFVIERRGASACRYTGVADANAQITDLKQEPADDADLRWRTDAATVQRIVTADNPGQTAQESFENGAHRLQPTPSTGIVDRVALGATNTVADIARGLGVL